MRKPCCAASFRRHFQRGTSAWTARSTPAVTRSEMSCRNSGAHAHRENANLSPPHRYAGGRKNTKECAHAHLAPKAAERPRLQQALQLRTAHGARRRRAGGDRATLCRSPVLLGPLPAQKMPAAPALSRRAARLFQPQQGPEVPDIFHGGARYQVILGGPRRIPPANHVEWAMRRTPASLWFR